MNWASNPSWDRLFDVFGPEGPRPDGTLNDEEFVQAYAEADAKFTQDLYEAQRDGAMLQPEPVNGVYVITAMPSTEMAVA